MTGAAGARGFTLVELLVAVLAFGLLAAAAYTGLNGLASGAGRLGDRADELAALQRAVAALDQDLRQLVSRAAARPDGRWVPALAGAADGWQGHRAGRWSPDGTGSVLQTVAWRCHPDGRLERRGKAGAGRVFTGATGVPAAGDLQLHPIGCRALRLRYRDAVGVWHSRWPVDERPAQLPSAIEYRLETSAFGGVRRLVTL
ncbi:type II secretion system minor pseudopilin GspJ [Halomonas denitrificans]|nr:type II secretion system minor pseudopilin GspJ [Halomonas denitrificans]